MPLPAYSAFAADDLLGQVVLERMLAGSRPAGTPRIAEPIGKQVLDGASSTGRSAAGRCVIVALSITADGRKLPVEMWDGATENKTVVRAMLADLVSRGLSAEDGLLVVIDGAKALSAVVDEVFGVQAAVQRCTLHKRRNVAEHLPDNEKAWVDAKLVQAFNHPDPDLGLRNAKHLARLLHTAYPGSRTRREELEEISPSPAWASTGG